jgi:hypothetical protein
MTGASFSVSREIAMSIVSGFGRRHCLHAGFMPKNAR